jgi:hypothetical protein
MFENPSSSNSPKSKIWSVLVGSLAASRGGSWVWRWRPSPTPSTRTSSPTQPEREKRRPAPRTTIGGDLVVVDHRYLLRRTFVRACGRYWLSVGDIGPSPPGKPRVWAAQYPAANRSPQVQSCPRPLTTPMSGGQTPVPSPNLGPPRQVAPAAARPNPGGAEVGPVTDRVRSV